MLAVIPLLIVLLIGGVAFGICIFFFMRTRRKIASIEAAEKADVGGLRDGYYKTFRPARWHWKNRSSAP